ncbi:hypothetical protein [Methylobacterium sp. WL64]|uniref:hypothetical protein n=1 Tax=Methylobacterium sp. WL64 TaxID=2603894 RepID=UPI001FEDBEB4|nr:hypothetical protein [Methylobacterium sp. WL64]
MTARPSERTGRRARSTRSSSRQGSAGLYRAGMRTALAALTLSMAAGVALAQQPPPTVPELLSAEARAALGCEGSGDPAVIREQCRLRDRLSGRLAQAGYCWGRKGQTDEKKDWHACQPDSIFEDDIEAVQR